MLATVGSPSAVRLSNAMAISRVPLGSLHEPDLVRYERRMSDTANVPPWACGGWHTQPFRCCASGAMSPKLDGCSERGKGPICGRQRDASTPPIMRPSRSNG